MDVGVGGEDLPRWLSSEPVGKLAEWRPEPPGKGERGQDLRAKRADVTR